MCLFISSSILISVCREYFVLVNGAQRCSPAFADTFHYSVLGPEMTGYFAALLLVS